MSFYEYIQNYDKSTLLSRIENYTKNDVMRTLQKENFSPQDYLVLISPAASNCLEEMAVKARAVTLRHFGRALTLFAPIYLANYCVNQCVYCSFNHNNILKRKKLTIEELYKEAEYISSKGIRHILLLTGESRKISPVEYMLECAEVCKKFFTSIGVEVYPLEEEEYGSLVRNGVDNLTMFQEAYDKDVYKVMHPGGPKSNYQYRIEAPERACRAGMRNIGMGALLGLGDWRTESFFTVLHANYINRNFPGVEINISLPRIRPNAGSFEPPYPANDRAFVQVMLATRIILPYAGITLSTRENAEFRDNLVGLGVTRLSAESSTEVGGYTESVEEGKSDGQFEISDGRTVAEISKMLYSKGYQPVFKDWQYI